VTAAFMIPGRIPHVRCLAVDDPGALDLLRTGSTKLVHLIRHGESAHQVKAAEAKLEGRVCRCHELRRPSTDHADECPYLDPSLVDSPLTDKGIRQAAGRAIGCSAEVVLVSPTTRALQTAAWAFGVAGTLPANDAPCPFLPRATPFLPPVVALEELRARVGAHRQSQRRSISDLARDFPFADFTAVADDADTAWSPRTETRTSLDIRAALFLQTLFERPETSIAVVTHFTMLLTLFNPPDETILLGNDLLRPDRTRPWLDYLSSPRAAELHALQAPGEVRSVVLSLSDCPS